MLPRYTIMGCWLYKINSSSLILLSIQHMTDPRSGTCRLWLGLLIVHPSHCPKCTSVANNTHTTKLFFLKKSLFDLLQLVLHLTHTHTHTHTYTHTHTFIHTYIQMCPFSFLSSQGADIGIPEVPPGNIAVLLSAASTFVIFFSNPVSLINLLCWVLHYVT